MKNSLLLLRVILSFSCIAGLLAYSRSSSVLYCARPLVEGPGACQLGMSDAESGAVPHYVYLATTNECRQLCNDSTTIRSIQFKPFK